MCRRRRRRVDVGAAEDNAGASRVCGHIVCHRSCVIYDRLYVLCVHTVHMTHILYILHITRMLHILHVTHKSYMYIV